MSEYLALYSLTAAHLWPVTLVRAPSVWRIDDGYFCFVGTKMWPLWWAPGVRWPGVSCNRWRHPDQREYSDPWHYFYYINLHTEGCSVSEVSYLSSVSTRDSFRPCCIHVLVSLIFTVVYFCKALVNTDSELMIAVKMTQHFWRELLSASENHEWKSQQQWPIRSLCFVRLADEKLGKSRKEA